MSFIVSPDNGAFFLEVFRYLRNVLFFLIYFNFFLGSNSFSDHHDKLVTNAIQCTNALSLKRDYTVPIVFSRLEFAVLFFPGFL